MSRQGAGDEAGRFHVLDERGEVARARRTSLRQRHRLVDDHEAAVEQAHAGSALRVGFELLPDARRDLEPLREHRLHDLLRRRHAHDLRSLELAREVEIIGAARAGDDTDAFAIDLCIAPDRRVLWHQIRALDQPYAAV